MIIKEYFDISMPEIDIPNDNEMLGDAIRIYANDDIELRLAMFKIAAYFKRELHFDAFQYAAPYDRESDDECYAYLWTIEKNTTQIKSVVVGGFCFRKRDWGGYGFQWIWIHPFIRDTGLLKRHWHLFEEKFGKDFYCEPPYSTSMANFLSKKENILHIKDSEKRRPDNWQDLSKKRRQS